MKRNILIIILVFVTYCANAQMYSSEVLFFIEAGENTTDGTCAIVLCKGEKLYCLYDAVRSVKQNLKKDRNYYENNKGWRQKIFEYDSSRSTSSYHVYTKYYPESTTDMIVYMLHSPESYHCVAISKDKSIHKSWTEQEGVSPEPYNYIRVDKSELLPKAMNYDFLE